MAADRREHWERAYRDRAADRVSWYAPRLDVSLRLIQEVAAPTSAVIDVGAGASTLVDDLLALGYRDLTALDIAEAGLNAAQTRLDERADSVRWLQADITRATLPEGVYDLWHDRAVFHFLTDANDRRAYIDNLHRALKLGGHAIIATFAPDGPSSCSGLHVARYDLRSLGAELGEGFAASDAHRALHTTPKGVQQAFSFHRFRRR
ncbi:MAG: class I SAM-dependent methyltransferase [Myxococcales bacterium]|nr:class I SAM-dependent methyltransferase [Myxococcales bacterium]MDD9965785.1 class I SAM-dependent methyltransferase [Myxococcales bacterium]